MEEQWTKNTHDRSEEPDGKDLFPKIKTYFNSVIN